MTTMSVVRTKFVSVSSSSRQLHHRFGSGLTFSSRGGNSSKSTFSLQKSDNLLRNGGGVGQDLTKNRLLQLTSTDTIARSSKMMPLISTSRGSLSNNLLLLGRKHILLPTNNNMMTHNYFVAAASTSTTMRIYSSSSQPPNTPRNRLISILGTVGAGSMLLLGKGKYILGALKLTKFASLGSMLLTVGAYTAFYGFPYAVGMTSLILIHESGHALVMHRLGIPFSPMVFIPFMGAAVAMKQRPKDAYEEALVAFGGPVLGSMGALGVASMAHMSTTDNAQLLYALSDFGFMINLFNLIPLGTLDGGRICGAISPYAGVVGLGMGGLMAYEGMVSNPIFYLILLGGGYETFMRFYDPLGHAPPNYYRITSTQRLAITGGYFGLVGALFAAMAWNQQYMLTPEQLQRKRALHTTSINDKSNFWDFD